LSTTVNAALIATHPPVISWRTLTREEACMPAGAFHVAAQFADVTAQSMALGCLRTSAFRLRSDAPLAREDGDGKRARPTRQAIALVLRHLPCSTFLFLPRPLHFHTSSVSRNTLNSPSPNSIAHDAVPELCPRHPGLFCLVSSFPYVPSPLRHCPPDRPRSPPPATLATVNFLLKAPLLTRLLTSAC
jgi:hypothetical protein